MVKTGGSQKAIKDCRFRGDSSLHYRFIQNDNEIIYPLIISVTLSVAKSLVETNAGLNAGGVLTPMDCDMFSFVTLSDSEGSRGNERGVK